MSQAHARSRTTPRTCAEIKAPSAPLVELAERYKIRRARSLSGLGIVGCETASAVHFSPAFCPIVELWACKSGKNCPRWGRCSLATPQVRQAPRVAKWKGRQTPQDLSHRPHKLSTKLTPAQQAIALKLRCMARLALDDFLAVVQEFINPDVSRSRLDRCLRRHGVAKLRTLQAQAPADMGEVKAPTKTFKGYEPGFLQMDIKYLPQAPDEAARRYLFVAIDRATRWVVMHIYAGQSEASSVSFLERLREAAPIKITKLLTDNRSRFTDRFTSKKRESTGRHKFDVRCKALGIEHRLCPPRHPQANGMVERLNGRISEGVNQTRFAAAAELEANPDNYLKKYSHRIPQRALNRLLPVPALKNWHAEKPHLFMKRGYYQARLDTYAAGPPVLAVCRYSGATQSLLPI